VLTLFLQLRLLHQKSLAAAATLENQPGLNSTSCLQASI
jgi:hypothetical protein